MNIFIEKLHDEHQHALRELAALNDAAETLRESGYSDDAVGRMRIAAAFINNDVRTHNEREETYLFPELERVLPPSGPTGVMRSEHRALWDSLTALEDVLTDVRSDCEPALIHATCVHAFAIVNLLAAHISKEENILFPMAERLLQPARLETLEKVMKKLFPAE